MGADHIPRVLGSQDNLTFIQRAVEGHGGSWTIHCKVNTTILALEVQIPELPLLAHPATLDLSIGPSLLNTLYPSQPLFRLQA